MSKVKMQTIPNLLESSHLHQSALVDVNKHYNAWSYNVADHLKGMSVAEIKSHLQKTANPFAVCMEHLIGDFNFGTVIRNANAFNAIEVFYVGDKKWDRRSAVGVHNYTEVKWIERLEDFIALKDKYTIIGIDNIPGQSVPLSSFHFTPNTLLVFGEEGVGLTPVMQSLCTAIVEIEQFGSVRSLNVGVASGIIMHQFISQKGSIGPSFSKIRAKSDLATNCCHALSVDSERLYLE